MTVDELITELKGWRNRGYGSAHVYVPDEHGDNYLFYREVGMPEETPAYVEIRTLGTRINEMPAIGAEFLVLDVE